jgi:hypothetical protein
MEQQQKVKVAVLVSLAVVSAAVLVIVLFAADGARRHDAAGRAEEARLAAMTPEERAEAQHAAVRALLSEFEKMRSAGQPEAARKLAEELMRRHPGTPEAERVEAELPELDTAIAAAVEVKRVSAERAVAEAEAKALAGKWSYRNQQDSMTGRKATYASIESENTVTFGFPYQGEQRATLLIRNHPSYGLDVILSIQRGQILCQSYTDCSIRVRFDEQNPVSWNAVGPSDNSSTAVLLRNEARFIKQLRAAKLVRLQIPFYQEGSPIFEFRVGGFDYSRFESGG